MSIKHGGEVIESGGYGCIFKPSIKCKNNNIRNQNINYVSKLMVNKHAKEEYQVINNINKILSRIPNYDKYFNVNSIELCVPKHLTKKDLTSFNTKCSALKKKNFTRKNINKKLSKLLALNMPYGGVSIDQFIELNIDNPDKLLHLNNSMINLLNNGIILMNALGVYHCDVKGSNILIDPNEIDSSVKLIDWGLSVIFTDNHKKIPSQVLNRPFQYNIPYSIILFNDVFDKEYNDFLHKNDWSRDKNTNLLIEFIINYIDLWNNTRGEGHLETINKDLQYIFPDKVNNYKHLTLPLNLDKYSIAVDYIVHYIFNILYTFTINNYFNKHLYFTNVFIKNIDIWGFIMSYPHPYTPNDKLRNNRSLPIFQNIIKHLFDSSDKVINTNFVTFNLLRINKLY